MCQRNYCNNREGIFAVIDPDYKKPDLDLLLRTYDLATGSDKISLACVLVDYCIKHGLYEHPNKGFRFPFRDSVAWSRVQLLAKNPTFCRVLEGRTNEQAPLEISYTIMLYRSRERGIKGFLTLHPTYRRVTLSEEEKTMSYFR